MLESTPVDLWSDEGAGNSSLSDSLSRTDLTASESPLPTQLSVEKEEPIMESQHSFSAPYVVGFFHKVQEISWDRLTRASNSISVGWSITKKCIANLEAKR